jgi:cellulose 1,4-beta-cellobiosidase
VTHPYGWVGCDPKSRQDDYLGFQGAFYAFGDGVSCSVPKGNPCEGGRCCLKGATVVDATYKKWGCGLGLELSSSGGAPPIKAAYSGPVKCFNVAFSGNTGGNALRVSFKQSANMNVSPFVELPAFTNGWKGTLCFDDVACPTDWGKTDCQMSGTPYDLLIQIIGGERAANYDFCLSELTPKGSGGGGGSSVPTIPPLDTKSSTCDRWGEVDFGNYLLRNNVWNDAAAGATQCITTKQGSSYVGFDVTKATYNVSTDAPAAYPSIVKGWHWGKYTSNSGMPKQVTQISSVPSVWVFDTTGGKRYNASYDLWLHPDGNPGSPSGGLELMVWLSHAGQAPFGKKVATINAAGGVWNVYYGQIQSWGYVAYARTSNVSAVNMDLKPFIQDAVDRGYAKSNWNLLSVQAGFEVWEGGQGMSTKGFNVEVK